MDYQDTLTYLYNSVPMFQQVGGSAYKEGLENTLTLDAHFEHPHRSFRSIHVAGTNGKAPARIRLPPYCKRQDTGSGSIPRPIWWISGSASGLMDSLYPRNTSSVL